MVLNKEKPQTHTLLLNQDSQLFSQNLRVKTFSSSVENGLISSGFKKLLIEERSHKGAFVRASMPEWSQADKGRLFY